MMNWYMAIIFGPFIVAYKVMEFLIPVAIKAVIMIFKLLFSFPSAVVAAKKLDTSNYR